MATNQPHPCDNAMLAFTEEETNQSVYIDHVTGIEQKQSYNRLSLLSYSPGVVTIFSVAYLVIFVLALVSNGVVIAVVWRSPGMRNVTSYLLANLAAADIAVALFVMPITLLSTLFTGRSRSHLIYVYPLFFHRSAINSNCVET